MAKIKVAGITGTVLMFLAWSMSWAMGTAQAANSHWELGDPVVTHLQSLQTGIKELWQIPLGFSRRHPDAVTQIWPLGKAVYVTTRRGFLISVSAHAGTINWDAKPARSGHTIARPVLVSKKTIMILALGHAKVMSIASGRVLKSSLLAVAPGTSPILSSGRLLVGGAYGGFYGLSSDFPGTVRWAQLSNNDSFTSQPVLTSNGSVTFGSMRGYVWNKNATDGTGVWKRTLGGGVQAPLSSNDKLIFVPCRDGNLYAFDVFNGQCPWIIHLAGRLDSRAVPEGKQVLIASGGVGLYSISIVTGLKTWGPVKGIKKIAAISHGRIIAAGSDNDLHILSEKSGRELAKVRIPYARFFAMNAAGSVVYLVTSHGELAALAMKRSD